MDHFEREEHEGDKHTEQRAEPRHEPENKPHEVKHHETKHEHKQVHHKPKVSTSSNNWSGFQKFLAVAVVVQVLLSLYIISGLGDLTGAPSAPAALAPPSGAAVAPPAPAPTVDAAALAESDAVKGDPNAPVTIVEFSDYECPFCARFYSQTLAQLDTEYIQTGKVKLIYRDFPLSFHREAQKAAEAAECAGAQDQYYDMHDKLFESGVVGGVATFKRYAGELGLNQADFDSCLDSGEMASEVRKDFSEGSQFGVQGTPAFFINGKLLSGAQPIEAFRQVIDAELS
jgi:protein-disulfide isomerase